jgi:hypothetical protein
VPFRLSRDTGVGPFLDGFPSGEVAMKPGSPVFHGQWSGWTVAEVYEFGISGAKGRDKRPALNRLLKDANRRRFDVAMA